jgi:quercetin dioxygenase-like cupin family protein
VKREDSVVLPCPDLAAALGFFTGQLGFRLDAIFPADDPRVAEISGHGVRIRLERAPPVRVPVGRPDARRRFTMSKRAEAAWVEGRAGMRYRDLLPDREGGRVIASHVTITEAGPVPDYVHFHEVAFQLIVCVKGWVRVVYEDQGPPFVLLPGDGVLQPPRIRHRVLESSAGLEVVEITSPAEHATRVDHELELPTPLVRADRSFDAQRFVRHEASRASWQRGAQEGVEVADLGVERATSGLAGARMVRVRAGARLEGEGARGDLHILFVSEGRATLAVDGGAARGIETGDAFALPEGVGYAISEVESGIELLEVTLSALPTG